MLCLTAPSFSPGICFCLKHGKNRHRRLRTARGQQTWTSQLPSCHSQGCNLPALLIRPSKLFRISSSLGCFYPQSLPATSAAHLAWDHPCLAAAEPLSARWMTSCTQITAEQILRESKAIQLEEEFKPPTQRITDETVCPPRLSRVPRAYEKPWCILRPHPRRQREVGTSHDRCRLLCEPGVSGCRCRNCRSTVSTRGRSLRTWCDVSAAGASTSGLRSSTSRPPPATSVMPPACLWWGLFTPCWNESPVCPMGRGAKGLSSGEVRLGAGPRHQLPPHPILAEGAHPASHRSFARPVPFIDPLFR